MQRHHWIGFNSLKEQKSAPECSSGRTRRAQAPSQHFRDCPAPAFLQEIPRQGSKTPTPRLSLGWIRALAQLISACPGVVPSSFSRISAQEAQDTQESQPHFLCLRLNPFPRRGFFWNFGGFFRGILSQFRPFPCKCFSPV